MNPLNFTPFVSRRETLIRQIRLPLNSPLSSLHFNHFTSVASTETGTIDFIYSASLLPKATGMTDVHWNERIYSWSSGFTNTIVWDFGSINFTFISFTAGWRSLSLQIFLDIVWHASSENYLERRTSCLLSFPVWLTKEKNIKKCV